MLFRNFFRFWGARRPARVHRPRKSHTFQLTLETLEGRYAAGDVLISIATLTALVAANESGSSDQLGQTQAAILATDLSSATPPPPVPLLNPNLQLTSSGTGTSTSSGGQSGTTNSGGASGSSSPSSPMIAELAGFLNSSNVPSRYVPPQGTGSASGAAGGAGGAGSSAPSSSGASTPSGTSSSSSTAGSTILPPPTGTGSSSSSSASTAAGSASTSTTAAASSSATTTAASGSAASPISSAAASALSNASPGTQIPSGPPTPTATSLVILAPAYTSSPTPTITVEGATSLNFDVTPVRVDIDYQQDGSFTDAGDKNVPVQVISIGGTNDNVEVLTLPALSTGTWSVRVRVASASGETAIAVNTPDLGTQPVLFQPNVGQTTAGVTYVTEASDYTAFLTGNGAVLSLPDVTGNGASTLQMQIVKANTSGETIQGLQETSSITNYLIGNNPSDWVTNIPNYGSVQYNNVYNDVNLTYLGDHGNLAYQFTVEPGNSPTAIKLNYTLGQPGNTVEQVLPNGELLLLDTSTYNVVVVAAPTMYQVNSQGNQVPVQGGYEINAGGSVGFTVGAYDTSENLVIDPSLLFSTYFGGSGDESNISVAVDSGGSAYICGETTGNTGNNFPLSSATLPASDNGSSTQGGATGFVAKFGNNGGLIYSTFCGGSSAMGANQSFQGIAVDSGGNAYVTGVTNDADYPIINAAQSQNNGGEDAVVTVLNATGTNLIYSTYFGGAGDEIGGGIALSGNTAYITGQTTSVTTGNNFFTTTPGVVQGSTNNNFGGGDHDSFIAAFNTRSSGPTSLLLSTYVGGNHDSTVARAIAIDPTNGDVFVTGNTNNHVDFPLGGAAGQSFDQQSQEAAFVLSLNSALSSYIYGMVLSGNGSDDAFDIAVNANGAAYVCGSTTSNNFPVTAGAFQTGFPPGLGNGNKSGFVTKIAPGDSSLAYSTYLGGNNAHNFMNNAGDIAYGIALDSSGNAYVVGQTSSDNFPLVGAIEPTYEPGVNAMGFVSILNPSGSGLLFSTYIGPTSNGGGQSVTTLDRVALDPSSDIYVSGFTNSTNFIVASAFQANYGGGNHDAVLFKLGTLTSPPPPPPPPPGIPPVQAPGQEVSLYPDDRYEPNETEDAATNFGPINPGDTDTYSNLTINIHADGLPDYDWYTWTAATSGTFTASITVNEAGKPTSLLEFHLFTVDSENTLIPGPAVSAGYLQMATVTIQLSAGESIYVEVLGANSAPNYRDQGVYTMTVGFTSS